MLLTVCFLNVQCVSSSVCLLLVKSKWCTLILIPHNFDNFVFHLVHMRDLTNLNINHVRHISVFKDKLLTCLENSTITHASRKNKQHSGS